MNLTRRALLQGVAAFAAIGTTSGRAAAQPRREFSLVCHEGQAQLVPDEYGKTDVWCYNDNVPGPEIRVRQGERVRINLENQLGSPTTVHWHGLRLDNSMDGVPWLTQDPVKSGESFVYEFDAVDAGTFWYHPHFESTRQIGRGLYGPLIVEEYEPPSVDRDLTWVLDDWRLEASAVIVDDFDDRHDASHGGRIGNTITINGRFQPSFSVRPNERIRLRLINAANARIFRLNFGGLVPTIVAVDGNPLPPHVPDRQQLTLGPAMRADLILDTGDARPGAVEIADEYYRDRSSRIATLEVSGEPVRTTPSDSMLQLASNPIAEPDLGNAVRYEVRLEGGAMGQMAGAMMDGEYQDIRNMVHKGRFWAINGVAATGHMMEPLLSFQRGQSVVLTIDNQTMWPHPIHLHGHTFRVLSRNGNSTQFKEWQDTVLVDRNEQVEIAFVADNPGDWMFHCHILEHQASGMMGVVRVS